MPFMWAWYMCIDLAGADEAVMSSFRVMLYQCTTSMVEHCDLAAMYLMIWYDLSTLPEGT